MQISKENTQISLKEQEFLPEIVYDHYFAIDWSQETVAIAHMRSNSRRPNVIEMKSDIRNLIKYFKQFQGKKILTIEETTSTHWLFVKLRGEFRRILICDPYRNALLSEGPKTDSIDASKLCLLLRAGLLREVFHTLEHDYWIRKLVMSYISLVRNGTRVLNQKSAIYRALGLRYKKEEFISDNKMINFVYDHLEDSIAQYREHKQNYEKLFSQLCRTDPVIGYLSNISGIGVINAVKTYAIVLDATRFIDKYHFWSYCGLVRHDKQSGGRSYGKRSGRYNGILKSVFKSAAMAAIGGNNDIRNYYDTLLSQGLSPDKASHAVSRYIATSCYAVMKYKQPYKPYNWRQVIETSKLN